MFCVDLMGSSALSTGRDNEDLKGRVLGDLTRQLSTIHETDVVMKVNRRHLFPIYLREREARVSNKKVK